MRCVARRRTMRIDRRSAPAARSRCRSMLTRAASDRSTRRPCDSQTTIHRSQFIDSDRSWAMSNGDCRSRRSTPMQREQPLDVELAWWRLESERPSRVERRSGQRSKARRATHAALRFHIDSSGVVRYPLRVSSFVSLRGELFGCSRSGDGLHVSVRRCSLPSISVTVRSPFGARSRRARLTSSPA